MILLVRNFLLVLGGTQLIKMSNVYLYVTIWHVF